VRYYKTNNGPVVEIGDGYRHGVFIDGKYWNRILKIIRDEELDKNGIKTVLNLMSAGLREEYWREFIKAVKHRIIKNV